MKNIFQKLTLIFLLILIIFNESVNAQSADSTLKPLDPAKCIQIGANININNYDNTSHPFVDFFKLNEGWTPVNTTFSSLRFDRDGYVTNGLTVSTRFSLREVPDSMKFTIFWDGFARDSSKLPISVSGIKLIPNTSRNTSTGGSVQVIKGFDYGYISIVNSASTSDTSKPLHVRNIRVIREGYENTYLSNPFNPEFIDQILPQGKIMINAMQSNIIDPGSNYRWKDRVQTSSFSQVSDVAKKNVNIPYEYGIKLANITGKDLWVNIPYYADEEYVTQMAKLHKAQLDKNINVYVEYSYELWNWGSPMMGYSYLRKLVKSDVQIFDTIVHLTKRNWKIWKDVFGADADRVNRVLGCQVGYPPQTGSLQAVDRYGKGSGNFEVIAVACGLSFGSKEEEAYKIGSNITPGQINNFILEDWNSRSSTKTYPYNFPLLAFSKEARRANAKLVVYGGGVDLWNDYSNMIPETKKIEASMHTESLEPLHVAVFDTLKKYGFSEFNFFGLNGSKSSAYYSIMGGTFSKSTIISSELRTDAKDLIVKFYNNSQDCSPVLDAIDELEYKLENNVTLFPNPTTGLFRVNLAGVKSDQMSIQCFNSMGNLIYQGKSKNLDNLDFLSSKPNGIYNIQFTIDGNKVNKRIMKY